MDATRDAWLRQATRHRILLAAETCFAAHGFDGSGVEQIARAARVSKSHLYYHFASKVELLSCLVELRTADLLAAKGALMNGLDTQSLLGDPSRLQRVLERAITDVLLPHRAFIRIALVEVIRNASAAEPFFAALDTMLQDSLTRLSGVGVVVDVPTTKSLLFYFAILPALFRVAVDHDPIGRPGGAVSLAGHLTQVEQAFLVTVWAPNKGG